MANPPLGITVTPPTGPVAKDTNVVPFGNVTPSQAAQAGSAYSQAYNALNSIVGSSTQTLKYDQGILAVGNMPAAKRNSLNSLLMSLGYANAKNQHELQSHWNSVLSEYKSGLAANANLTLYGMVAGQINSGSWNTTPTSKVKHYFVPPVGTSYNVNTNTFQIAPAAATSPSATSQASTLNSVEMQMENWGFPEQTIKKMTPRLVAAVASGVDTTKGIDVWLREQPEYAQQFPGNITRMKNGLPPLKEDVYTSFVQAMQEAGRAAGLPQGFLTSSEIGTLIANEVKPAEFTKRLTNAFESVQNADPTVLQALQDHFGLTPGHLAAWALDPKKATDLIAQQVQEAKYMSETQMAGMKQGMSVQQAEQLYQYGQTTGVGESGIRSDIDQAARQQSLIGSAPGQVRQGVSQQQLIAGTAGYDPKARQAVAISKAEQAAPTSGGGGDLMSQKGVVGAGYAE